MTTRERSMEEVLVGTFEAVLQVPNLPPRSWPEQSEAIPGISNPGKPLWARPTIERVLALPWNQEGWQEGARAPSTDAASQLLLALSTTLLPDSPVPDISPMWDGGVCAEWHRNGVDLELYVAPDGDITWSFEDLGSGEEEELEAGQPVWQIHASKLPDYVRRLGPGELQGRV